MFSSLWSSSQFNHECEKCNYIFVLNENFEFVLFIRIIGVKLFKRNVKNKPYTLKVCFSIIEVNKYDRLESSKGLNIKPTKFTSKILALSNFIYPSNHWQI